MGGQDDEASAELIATIKAEHQSMKAWYNETTNASVSALRDAHGSSYPSFWRDVVGWSGWRDVRRCYLKNLDGIGTDAGDGISSTNAQSTVTVAAAPRKRKSRWASAPTTTESKPDGALTGVIAERGRRRSRWAKEEPAATGGGNGTTDVALAAAMGGAASGQTVLDLLPASLSAENLSPAKRLELESLQAKLREANHKMTNLEVEATRVDALPRGHVDRSPSPPPVYGADGIRRNTRAVRWRERYTNQRQDALEKILSMTSAGHNPNAVAPSLFRRRRTRKIHIPVEQHPTYNFIGLIIGPRGKTQKEMETKTGCKIAIRGKGSVKEGARGRRDGKSMDGDDEPLHVVITGDNQGNVDAAADMVEQMLVVIDDDKNVHKQNQLRELALLNGTLKDEEFCAICSERGHRSFECPKRFSGSKGGAVSVKCALCGDTSHPTRDCALNKKGAEIGDLKEGESEKGGASAVEDGKKLDSDYLSFMAELDGKPPPSNEDNISAVTSINPVVTINAPAVPLPSSSDFVITTISSRIVQPGEQNDEGNGNNIETVGSGMGTAMGCGSHNALTTSEGVDALGNGTLPPPSAVHTIVNAVSLPPPPPSSSVLDPSISILPPLPVVPAVTVAVGTFPPQLPPHPVISNLPPPPSLPPPLSVAHQYQGYGMQQAYYPPPPVGGIGVGVGGFGVGGAPFSPPGGHFGGYVPQQNIHGPGHGQDHGGGGPPNQDLSHGKQSGNSGAWDYKSYYGTEDKGGDAEGAGGFNWWES